MTVQSTENWCADEFLARLLLVYAYITVWQISDVSNGNAAMNAQHHNLAVSTVRDQQALDGR